MNSTLPPAPHIPLACPTRALARLFAPALARVSHSEQPLGFLPSGRNSRASGPSRSVSKHEAGPALARVSNASTRSAFCRVSGLVRASGPSNSVSKHHEVGRMPYALTHSAKSRARAFVNSAHRYLSSMPETRKANPCTCSRIQRGHSSCTRSAFCRVAGIVGPPARHIPNSKHQRRAGGPKH